jgi:hypothetical protein
VPLLCRRGACIVSSSSNRVYFPVYHSQPISDNLNLHWFLSGLFIKSYRSLKSQWSILEFMKLKPLISGNKESIHFQMMVEILNYRQFYFRNTSSGFIVLTTLHKLSFVFHLKCSPKFWPFLKLFLIQ